jgi:hypothetical protein
MTVTAIVEEGGKPMGILEKRVDVIIVKEIRKIILWPGWRMGGMGEGGSMAAWSGSV